MANGTQNDIIFRDGTSQRSRMLPALDPKYFSVEEHSTEDLLRFAQKFAKELKFFNLDNQEDGDWSGLLGDTDRLIPDILAFIENPAAFDHDPVKKAWLTRPHLSVFLEFLEMLKGPKALFDDLTRRHLEHYYREVLRFGLKSWKPDRAHVLFEPAKGTDSVVLPKGTLLQAGKDAKGKFLHYQTLHETVVNQARVADIRTTFLVPERNYEGAPVNENAGMLYADIAWQDGQDVHGKFQALGADLPQKNLTSPTLAKVGFMIESPLFWLSGGGTRDVYLILPTGGDNTVIWNAFKFEFSCADGKWYEPERNFSVEIPNGILPQNGDYDKSEVLKFTIDFSEGAPAFAPPSGETGFKHPVLRAILHQTDEVSYYKAFDGPEVRKIGVCVVAEGIDASKIRNDQVVLNPKGPFEPFGTYPQKGAAFTFSHPELCQKPVQEIRMSVEWRGLPDSPTQYLPYIKYLKSLDPNSESDLSFQVQLTDADPVKVEMGTESTPFTARKDYSGALENLPESDDPFDYPRRFALKLGSDLLHNIYPQVLQWCAAPANTDKCTKPVPPPYTPAIQSFSLGYTSFAETPSDRDRDRDTRFYHIHIFGVMPAENIMDHKGNPFFRMLPADISSGCLFVGIAGLAGPTDLNLLFQMWPRLSEQAEKMPEVALRYLKNDSWENLVAQENILYDATQQLFQTGLVRLRLPKVESLVHRLMPQGLYWLRAESDAKKASWTGDVVAIHAQAMEAEFVNRDNTLEHLQRPLPVGSIKTLVQRGPEIKTVTQPYTSFGGRPMEAPEHLYTRVSERLRHKQRALTAWDYERLVLEHFPEVYKVKCLLPKELEQVIALDKNTAPDRQASYNPASGAVTLVVISDISNTSPFFPIEPRAPRVLLNDIAAFLADYSSPFAKITVKNPRYEYIRYRMDIRFQQYADPAIYIAETQEALQRYLSPWAYEQGADISFGSRIYHSEVIYFLENLPYVDYVVNFKLVRRYTNPADRYRDCFSDPGHATASRPDAVLVSDPAHFIGSVPEGDYDPGDYRGVGYDRVGVDEKIYD